MSFSFYQPYFLPFKSCLEPSKNYHGAPKSTGEAAKQPYDVGFFLRKPFGNTIMSSKSHTNA